MSTVNDVYSPDIYHDGEGESEEYSDQDCTPILDSNQASMETNLINEPNKVAEKKRQSMDDIMEVDSDDICSQIPAADSYQHWSKINIRKPIAIKSEEKCNEKCSSISDINQQRYAEFINVRKEKMNEFNQVKEKLNTLKLKDIKYVDDLTFKLINGYLRRISNALLIPNVIITICTLFYFIKEYFAIMINGYTTDPNYTGDYILFDDDKLSASRMWSCHGSIYGNICIDSLSDVICKWYFKIIPLHEKDSIWDAMFVDIGIHGGKVMKHLIENNIGATSFLTNGNGKILTNKRSIREKEVWYWKGNDVLSIKLNMKDRNVEYFVNDESIGIFFRDIPIGDDIKYRLAICLDGVNVTVKLIDFQYV